LNIGLGFSYFNSAKEIPRALTPWVPQVDYIIAIDGRYRTPITPEMRKQDLPIFSTDNSFDVLEKLCKEKFIYDKLFDTQIQKRQRYLDLAGELGCDVLIVWDSDETIHPDYQDWDKFHKQLEYVLNFNEEEQLFGMYAWIPDEEQWPKQHNMTLSNIWKKYTRIHKNPGSMRYATNHYTWCKKDVTDKEIMDYNFEYGQGVENPYLLPFPTACVDGIRIAMDRNLREAGQLTFGDGWAFQEIHEDAFKVYNHWRNHQPQLEPLDPSRPHYFNEMGKIVWYDEIIAK